MVITAYVTRISQKLTCENENSFGHIATDIQQDGCIYILMDDRMSYQGAQSMGRWTAVSG